MSDAAESEGARYKIGEVCKLADVQPYVLKYWETEFPLLASEKGAPGPRTYSERDLHVIERIKKLLYDEGYTIAGAKKRLDAELRAGTLPATAASAGDGDSEAEGLVLTSAEPEAPAPRPKRARSPRPAPEPPAAPSDAAMEPAGEAAGEAGEKPVPQRSEAADAFELDLPQPPVSVDPSASPVVQPADPRLGQVVAELKEILRILKADPA